jgi:hypothetical protein
MELVVPLMFAIVPMDILEINVSSTLALELLQTTYLFVMLMVHVLHQKFVHAI